MDGWTVCSEETMRRHYRRQTLQYATRLQIN